MQVDCHFHVIAPQAEFSMCAERSYTPREASLAQWRQTLASLGFTHGVLIQPSFYGTDNRLLLRTLAEANGALVGVAAAQANITDQALDELAAAGVRGLRFAYLGEGNAAQLAGFVSLRELPDLAPRLRGRGMHVELLTDSRFLTEIEPILKAAQIPIVLAHMGRAPASLGATHPGITAMCRLLSSGWLWVKLSGLANISEQSPAYEDARAIHDALLSANPERLVWGSDWPHTKTLAEVPSTELLFQRFLEWMPKELQQRILIENPVQLYRLQS